ncbi:MAG: hypothetical protein AAF539_08185 [Planctomycetota bacterium]
MGQSKTKPAYPLTPQQSDVELLLIAKGKVIEAETALSHVTTIAKQLDSSILAFASESGQSFLCRLADAVEERRQKILGQQSKEGSQ